MRGCSYAPDPYLNLDPYPLPAAPVPSPLDCRSHSRWFPARGSGGRHSRQDKRRFYEMAKGSATECAAILDVLRIRGLGSPEDQARARTLIVRVVKMLSKLCGAPGRGPKGD